MEFTILDWVLVTVIGAVTVWDLVRGFSGQLGICAWVGVMFAVLAFGYGPVSSLVEATGWQSTPEGVKLASVCALVVTALLLALLASCIVKKLVSGLVPQPFNALLGGLAGLVKGALLLAVLAGAWIGGSDTPASGFFVRNSTLVAKVAEILP